MSQQFSGIKPVGPSYPLRPVTPPSEDSQERSGQQTPKRKRYEDRAESNDRDKDNQRGGQIDDRV